MSADDDDQVDARRRSLLTLATGAALVAIPQAIAGCSRSKDKTADPSAASSSSPAVAANPSVVRVASVPTAVEGGLLPSLVAGFEAQSGLRVQLVTSTDPYDLARAAQVDIAISHYGHKDAEQFVMDGFGEWPRTVFSNQMALLGPKSDPAEVRGLHDAVEAFKRIAARKALFILNDTDGVRYLTEILWHAAGRPDREGWMLDDRTLRRESAIHAASARGAYVLWGLTPFLRSDAATVIDLEPLVVADTLLQRMMVSIVVKSAKVGGVNMDGAKAFEQFLLSPATQARILEARYPGVEQCTWAPAGRHNRTAMLPRL